MDALAREQQRLEANKDIARQFFERLSAGDVDGVVALYPEGHQPHRTSRRHIQRGKLITPGAAVVVSAFVVGDEQQLQSCLGRTVLGRVRRTGGLG